MTEPGMNERVVELESRLAFQEQTLGELNQVIVDQQVELDRLTRKVLQLQQSMQVMQDSAEQDQGHEPPPHY
jgi:SlyX protein